MNGKFEMYRCGCIDFFLPGILILLRTWTLIFEISFAFLIKTNELKDLSSGKVKNLIIS